MTEPTPTYTVTRQRAPGAGRPTRYPAGIRILHVNIALSAAEVAWLDAQRGTGESRADVVRRLIAERKELR